MKKFSGMSLIETILYLGLVSLVLGALFSYGWNVMRLDLKARIAQEVFVTAQIISERLNYEIRQAQSVNQLNSNFESIPAKLALEKDGENVEIYESEDGRILIKRGSNNPVVLHSQNVRINNLIFTKQLSVENEGQYIGFSFEAEAVYPGSERSSEYQYSLPIRSGSALRTSH